MAPLRRGLFLLARPGISSARLTLRRHLAAHRGMDCQPTDGGLWLGATPSRSDPRSGRLLRRHLRPTRSLARHSRSSDVCTLALAERVCGAPDWLNPPGMPGSHCGDRRAATAPCPQMLHGVLQRGAHAYIVGQGCAHSEGHSARRAHRICGRDKALEHFRPQVGSSTSTAKRITLPRSITERSL